MRQRTLSELLNSDDPLWPLIQAWLAAATRPVEVLPVSRQVAEATLITLQVTTRSPLGAMAHETGGIFVDGGWLRLLGARSARMPESLLTWNGLEEDAISVPDACIVAHDVLGGFFAVNLGAFGSGPHEVHYLPPDSLRWQSLGVSYADFLHWAIVGDVAAFYAGVRWTGWQDEIRELRGNQGILFWPMLWSPGQDLAARTRKVVPQRELWHLACDLMGQLTGLPGETHVRLRSVDRDTTGASEDAD